MPAIAPPLQSLQVSPFEPVRTRLLQPVQQCPRTSVRILLCNHPRKWRHTHTEEHSTFTNGAGLAPSPAATDLFIQTPPVEHSGQERLQVLAYRRGPVPRHDGRQCRLGFPMECTGINLARRPFLLALASDPTVPCWISRSQGVAGEV